jgi:hypothetical protein
MSNMNNNIPSANDVLAGKGHRTFKHPGNLTYRTIIKSLKPEYDAAPKSLKGVYGNQIVNLIHSLSPPGRFLKKDKVSGSWIEVDNEEAVKRARQAFRDSKKLNRIPAAPTPEVCVSTNKPLIQQHGFQVSTSNDTDNSRFSII